MRWLLLIGALVLILIVWYGTTVKIHFDDALQALPEAEPWLAYMQGEGFVPAGASTITPPLRLVATLTVDRWNFYNRPVTAIISGDDWVVASTPRRVVAFDLATGRELWSVRPSQVAWGSAVLTSDGDRVYWVSRENDRVRLYMVPVRNKSGMKVIDLGAWNWLPGDGVAAGLNTYENGVLVALSAKDGTNLFAVSSDLDTIHWSAEAPGRFIRGSAAAVYRNTAYVATVLPTREQTGYVTALDVQNGHVVWQATVDHRLQQSPVIHNGKLYVISSNSRFPHIYRFDPATGQSTTLASYGWGTMTLWGSAVYAIPGTRNFSLIDLDTGTVQWERHEDGHFGIFPPLPTQNHVIAEVYGLRGLGFFDSSSGEAVWEFRLSDFGFKEAINSRILRGPFLFVGTNEGKLLIFTSESAPEEG